MGSTLQGSREEVNTRARIASLVAVLRFTVVTLFSATPGQSSTLSWTLWLVTWQLLHPRPYVLQIYQRRFRKVRWL
jgi:hypothetical protein